MTGSPTDTLFSVAGKSVVVTGGSSGIGAMIATGLVEAGARVLISARKADALAELAAALGGKGSCEYVVADVGTPDGSVAIAEAVATTFDDRLDILVNNAGATWGAPIDDFPDEAWHKLANVNLIGLFRLTTTLLGPLRRAATAEAPARVVNIGSLAGLRATGVENYPYSATKAGVHMLTRHLAHRLAREDITVNAIAPGYFPSRMSAFALDDEATRSELLSSVPLGRTGAPEDVVGAVRFLTSRAGAYLTGSVLEVDGGAAGAG
ncbi:SDR family oxidoreductase [[Mycobacterium] wendilense]|uniref:SDR family oxidoreductase n=1 Tax=[Mycobacterium] wendilense TaxID=3064284 RepID=A0ABM9MEV1_9MYCO|nr:SDR family oxidoreductase [Mycolicibacterium sp. MU0050]CAJ1583525.1 SDR family oxidoreductase [Mycolicibacterium sp. MU0050]